MQVEKIADGVSEGLVQEAAYLVLSSITGCLGEKTICLHDGSAEEFLNCVDRLPSKQSKLILKMLNSTCTESWIFYLAARILCKSVRYCESTIVETYIRMVFCSRIVKKST